MPFDPFGSATASWRERAERVVVEALRRMKVAVPNDPYTFPPVDDVSTVLAARMFVLPPVIPPPPPNDASAVLAARVFNPAALVNASSSSFVADNASVIIAAKSYGYHLPAAWTAPVLVAPTALGSLTMPESAGVLALAGRIRLTGNIVAAFATGDIARGPVTGVTVVAATGSSYDFYLANPAGSGIMYNPTGTLNMQFAGTITAPQFIGPVTGNVTGNVTGTSGSTSGNAATATALQTARTINGVSFNGTANISVPAIGQPLTFGTGLSAGSYDGSAPVTISLASTSLTVNGTAISLGGSGTVPAAAGTLTGATLAAGVTASSLTSLGTLAALVLGSGAAIDVVKTGAAATAGQATLVAGSVTVNTTLADTFANGRLIFLTRVTAGGTLGLESYTVVSGVSFTINSANPLDTSTFNWFIVRVH